MKIKTIIAFALVGLAVFLGLFLHSREQSYDVYPDENTMISLYGESHGYGPYYAMELDIWKDYYDKGYRNLFIEMPYYTAEFLNEWMKADSDDIIDTIWLDLQGTQSCNEDAYKFYHNIKEQCPETVFYGTDVGHQYFSTGERFKMYLEEKGLEDTDRYALTLENIRQGEEYYAEYAPSGISPIRENYMVENFIAAYDRCGGGKIMGIYGSYHTCLYDTDRMAGMLKNHFGDIMSGVALSSLAFEEVIHEPYEFGFCLTGLVFLIMLFLPNIIWGRGKQPKGYEEEAKNENKILLVFERAGEALTSAALLIFPALNPKMKLLPGGLFMEWDVIIWITAFVLMIFYECYWIKYFRSERTLKDMYASFAGFPVAGASLPVIAVLLLGIYSRNLIVIASAVILGIGHIGIHLMHLKFVIAALTVITAAFILGGCSSQTKEEVEKPVKETKQAAQPTKTPAPKPSVNTENKVSTIKINEHKTEDYFAEYQAPADDEYDYKWANDYYYNEINHLRKVRDAKGYEITFGFTKPTYAELCDAIDGNEKIDQKYAPHIKEYIQDWLKLYPETDFSNFLYNLKTLEVIECTRDEIKWATISADAVACYRPQENAIYISEKIDLSSRSNDDYIILGHELWHAARGGRSTLGDDTLIVGFYDDTRVGSYADEALDTYFMYKLQGEDKRSTYYVLACNYFRIIMDCLGDTYTGSDYLNHSVNYLAEKMDQYMEGTEYEGKALYILSVIEGEMLLHKKMETKVTTDEFPDLFGYLITMYCKKYLKEDMSSAQATQVFDDFMFEITWYMEGLRNPYDEINEDAFHPGFDACLKAINIAE